MKKTKIKFRHITKENMLTLRISNGLLKMLNAISKQQKVSRSTIIRDILEKNLDTK
jgi:metal-responsive CopG/Arc/MetJ family transcriptional regulator